MTTYLRFDGINDSVQNSGVAGNWSPSMYYRIKFTRGASALNGGVADAFCPANGRGLYLTDTTFQLYWTFGSFRPVLTFNAPVVENELKKLTFEFLSDQLTVNVYEDDVYHSTIVSSITIPAASDNLNIGSRYGGASPSNALISSIEREFTSSAVDSRHWSADSSDTSNTGQQPVLTEVLNGFDAVGVNMNTDGSDWVVVGAPASDIDLNVALIAPSPSLSADVSASLPEVNISTSMTSPSPSLSAGFSTDFPDVDISNYFISPSPSISATVGHDIPETDISIGFTSPASIISASFIGETPEFDVSVHFIAPVNPLDSQIAAVAPEYDLDVSMVSPSSALSSSVTTFIDDTDISLVMAAPTAELGVVLINGDIIRVTPAENIIHSKPRSRLLFTKDKGRYL